MAGGLSNSSASPGPVPDRSASLDDASHCLTRSLDDASHRLARSLDDATHRLAPSTGRAHDRSGAYETLISRALSEVFAHRLEEPGICAPIVEDGKVNVLPHRRLPEFAAALFEEDVKRCRAIAETVFSEEDDPQGVAQSLFGPAAWLIGEKWVADEADFLQVTIALSRIQQMFSRMAADRPPTVRPDPSRRLLLAPAPGEQHSFGLSVVEDAFQRAGWDVDRCQCGEDERVLRMAEANDYLVIGLSIGVGRLLPDLKSAVARLRAVSRNKSVVLMAGGPLVVQDPRSAIDSDFDFAAIDAHSGVRLADGLVSRGIEPARPPIAAQ